MARLLLLIAVRATTTYDGVVVVAGQSGLHVQCKDPLFETHWAGKTDIQTLSDFPNVHTNLKRCPAYNQISSCCHQTFESEQDKYYAFWIERLQQQLARANVHRAAVAAAVSSAAAASAVDVEQAKVALARYEALLAPSDDQTRCYSSLLTYVAGMICFVCKPEWTRYVVLSGGAAASGASATPAPAPGQLASPASTTSAPADALHVIRVRMARSVCNQIWAKCEPFGNRAAALASALRDSAIAKLVAQSEESFAAFFTQQDLCNWMHDEVALHPFKLPVKEAGNFQPLPVITAAPTAALPAAAAIPPNATSAVAARMLQSLLKQDFDVLLEGKMSRFIPQAWQGNIAATSAAIRRCSSCCNIVVVLLAIAYSFLPF